MLVRIANKEDPDQPIFKKPVIKSEKRNPQTNFEGDKSTFKGSYDKQNVTLMIISYQIH